ncbi:hypothetical protein BH92_19155 [Rhodococcoides fascians A21d2]|uniref:hypothetical protein n=1 Tax=Rhodococcoides fascians TaxID=1828 RepID=UPI00068C3D53|nr:hypothetical protein [Rhodococcus fascians]QII01706.1 hypothetical protein BH92_19155 [Rhodococcus fascians A21d2]
MPIIEADPRARVLELLAEGGLSMREITRRVGTTTGPRGGGEMPHGGTTPPPTSLRDQSGMGRMKHSYLKV